MKEIRIYPKRLDLLQYSTLVAMCQKIFTLATIAVQFKELGTLHAYLFDHDNEVKIIDDVNDYFKKKEFLLIYPEKTDFEVSIKLSYMFIGYSYLELIKDKNDYYDESDKFIYENQVTFTYVVAVGKDELGKVIYKIMTLAIALLTEGLIDLTELGLSSSDWYAAPNEFAKQFCELTDEEIEKIMS